MFAAFYNGVNGVKSQNFGIDITANNIANVNTLGFKYSVAEFSTIFNRTAAVQSTNPAQAGYGSMPNASKLVFEQGSFFNAESEFSVALNGKGFFGVMGADNAVFYTRNGDFTRDGNGNLVDAAGNYVLGTMNPNFAATTYSDRVASLMGMNLNTTPITQGFTVNNPSQDFAMGTNTTQTILQVPKNLYLSPEVTTEVSWKGSLNSNTQMITRKVDFDPAGITRTDNADGTVSFSGHVGADQIYSAKAGEIVIITLQDQNGIKKNVEATLDENLNFTSVPINLSGMDAGSVNIASSYLNTEQESADNSMLAATIYNADGTISSLRYTLERVLPQNGDNFEYNITAGVYDTDGNLTGSLSTGKATFSKNGALLSNTLTSVPNPNGGTISVNFGTPLSDAVGSGYDGVYINTKTTGDDSISPYSNGYAEGFFTQYSISKDGSLVAQFSNGRTATVGKLALYNFINEEGLFSVGGNNFQATSNSGPANFLYNAQGDFIYTASFVGQKLEQSATDLGNELTELIVMQKAYDASSKSITTSDQMIQRALEMKR